jgi:hypothetical protein
VTMTAAATRRCTAWHPPWMCEALSAAGCCPPPAGRVQRSRCSM